MQLLPVLSTSELGQVEQIPLWAWDELAGHSWEKTLQPVQRIPLPPWQVQEALLCCSESTDLAFSFRMTTCPSSLHKETRRRGTGYELDLVFSSCPPLVLALGHGTSLNLFLCEVGKSDSRDLCKLVERKGRDRDFVIRGEITKKTCR